MKFVKSEIKFRFLLDIVSGVLHDLQSPKNPANEGCNLEVLDNWVVFDTEREPVKGALIKKLTATKEVVDIEVKSLCSHCMTPEDENLIDLLQDYFIKHTD